MRFRYLGLGAALVAATLLAACGSTAGSDDAGTQGSASTPAGTSTSNGTGSNTSSSANADASADASSDDQSPTGAALTLWHYWDGNNAETFQAMVKAYEKDHAGTTIKLVNVPGSDLLTKLQAAAQSRTLPDVVIGDLVTVPRMAQTGAAVDLKGLIPDDVWSDIYPEMLKFGQQDGQQISIPVSANTLAWMYNKEIFTEAGIDAADLPSTWEELTDACATVKDKTGRPAFELLTQPGTDGEGVTWNFQVSLWQAGGEFLNADNSAAAFNSDAGRKALQFWVDLVTSGCSPLGPWGEFEKGNAGSAQEGSWMVGIWKPQPPFDFGTAQIPHPADGQAATNMGGEQAVVFAQDAAKQQAAADFLAWFDSPEQATSWSEKTGFLPVLKSVADSQDYQDYVTENLPELQPFVDALPTAHARPATPLYPQVSLAFAKEVEKALHGKAVDQALADAETAVNQILQGQ